MSFRYTDVYVYNCHLKVKRNGRKKDYNVAWPPGRGEASRRCAHVGRAVPKRRAQGPWRPWLPSSRLTSSRDRDTRFSPSDGTCHPTALLPQAQLRTPLPAEGRAVCHRLRCRRLGVGIPPPHPSQSPRPGPPISPEQLSAGTRLLSDPAAAVATAS